MESQMHLEYGILCGHYIPVSVQYISIYGNPETYLEPSRTSTMGLFCENSQRLSEKWKVLNLLNRKISYSGIIYAMWAWVARNKRQVEFFSSSPFSSLWLKGNYYKKKDVKRSRVQSPQPFKFIFLTLGKFDNITNCIQFILHWGLVFSW